MLGLVDTSTALAISCSGRWYTHFKKNSRQCGALNIATKTLALASATCDVIFLTSFSTGFALFMPLFPQACTWFSTALPLLSLLLSLKLLLLDLMDKYTFSLICVGLLLPILPPFFVSTKKSVAPSGVLAFLYDSFLNLERKLKRAIFVWGHKKPRLSGVIY